jgi:hypothetical protein
MVVEPSEVIKISLFKITCFFLLINALFISTDFFRVS